MWEKLRIQVRDRLLGALFMSVLAVVIGATVISYCLAGTDFPIAAQVVGISIVGIFWLFMVLRWLVVLRRNKYGAAPVGPLSSDEKEKARSKLRPARKQPGPFR
jgi:hypothetical protein